MCAWRHVFQNFLAVYGAEWIFIKYLSLLDLYELTWSLECILSYKNKCNIRDKKLLQVTQHRSNWFENWQKSKWQIFLTATVEVNLGVSYIFADVNSKPFDPVSFRS